MSGLEEFYNYELALSMTPLNNVYSSIYNAEAEIA